MKKGLKDDMTSLEFVNQNIFECENFIEHLENKIIEDKKYPSFVKAHKERIEELKPILKQLYQIKFELEAWEIVKNKNVKVSKVKSSPNFQVYDSLFNSDEIEKYRITEIEYDTIIKTLEVEE